MVYVPIPAGSLNWDVPVNAQFTTDDARLDNLDSSIAFLLGVINSLGVQITALQKNDPGPTDQGLKTWTYDPVSATGSVALTGGQLLLAKIPVVTGINSVFGLYHVGVAGSGLTAGQNWLALYDSTGTRVAVSLDQTTNFSSTGAKVAALTASLNAGFYWVAFLSNGTTPPSIRGFTAGSTNIANTGVSAAASRFGTFGAALTTTPTSFTPASITMDARSAFIGLN